MQLVLVFMKYMQGQMTKKNYFMLGNLFLYW